MKTILILITTFLFAVNSYADEFKVESSKSTMSVLGTSTLHDWEVTVNTMYGYMKTNDAGLPSYVKFSCNAKSLKSGKSKMDDIMHDALNAEDHPVIEFKMKSITQKGDNLVATGDLTINGVSREVELTVTQKNNGNTVEFTGTKSFKMTLFEMDPPTALLGTIKTGDEITVKFTVTFVKQS